MTNKTFLLKHKLGDLLNRSKPVKLFEILFTFSIAFSIIYFFKSLDEEDIIFNQFVVWIANIVMLVLIWIGLDLRKQSLKHIGLCGKKVNLKEAFKIFLKSILVFVLAMVGFVLGSIIMAKITGIPEKADMSSYSYLQNDPLMLVVTLFGVYIVSSIGEEVIYRGFLINRLSEIFGTNYGKWLAVIIGAIVFGLIHYSWGPMGIVQTFFMGLVLGICYIKMKNLWIMVLAHAYMDTILLLQIYFGVN